MESNRVLLSWLTCYFLIFFLQMILKIWHLSRFWDKVFGSFMFSYTDSLYVYNVHVYIYIYVSYLGKWNRCARSHYEYIIYPYIYIHVYMYVKVLEVSQ